LPSPLPVPASVMGQTLRFLYINISSYVLKGVSKIVLITCSHAFGNKGYKKYLKFYVKNWFLTKQRAKISSRFSPKAID